MLAVSFFFPANWKWIITTKVMQLNLTRPKAWKTMSRILLFSLFKVHIIILVGNVFASESYHYSFSIRLKPGPVLSRNNVNCMWILSLSLWHLWRLLSSGMWRRVIWQIISVSESRALYIFSVIDIPLKHLQQSARPHGVTSQTAVIFVNCSVWKYKSAIWTIMVCMWLNRLLHMVHFVKCMAVSGHTCKRYLDCYVTFTFALRDPWFATKFQSF